MRTTFVLLSIGLHRVLSVDESKLYIQIVLTCSMLIIHFTLEVFELLTLVVLVGIDDDSDESFHCFDDNVIVRFKVIMVSRTFVNLCNLIFWQMLNKTVFHLFFLVKDVSQTWYDFICDLLFLLIWDFIRIGLSLDNFTELLLKGEEICNKVQVTGFDIPFCIFDQSSCISKGGSLNVWAFSLSLV